MQETPFPNDFSSKKHELDFDWFMECLRLRSPFTFIRFSDGEMEILHNKRLHISDFGVQWSGGEVNFKYPRYDFKSFDPDHDSALRLKLLESARFRETRFIKGIPAGHNKSIRDRDWMIELNGGTHNLTFSDLLINQNYSRFVKELIPQIAKLDDITFISNFRSQVKNVNPSWQLIPVPDDAFKHFETLLADFVLAAERLDFGAIVLSSASSLSNIFGMHMRLERPDLTFIDVGTAMHPFIGLGDAKRGYHSQLLTWSLRNFRRKFSYQVSSSRKFKW